MTWARAIIVALILIAVSALYVRRRWRRAPQAYRAMLIIAACYFIAGSIAGAWILHLASPRHTGTRSTNVTVKAPSSTSAVSSRQASTPLSKFSAKVVSVADGDTVDVVAPSGQTYTVRLDGIDAPEHDQTFGSQSTANLATLVLGKNVTLECENERSHRRLICKMLLPDGEDADLDQLEAGMAWHYKQYQDEQSPAERTAYAAAECSAMKVKLGLWRGPHPEQPQDFRHGTHSNLLIGPDGCRMSSEPGNGAVLGNSHTHIFEWPGCPYYSSISPDRQVPFANPQAAEQAGYRPAHNCP